MENHSSTPHLTFRRGLWALVGMLSILILGFWIGKSFSPNIQDPSREPSRILPTTPIPEQTDGGLSIDSLRTRTGAVNAATRFAHVVASVSSDEEEYRETIRGLAAPNWVTEAEMLANNGLRFFNERYGSSGSFTFVPAKYRVASYSNSAATIEIWGVTVAEGPKIAGIEESWVTGTVELAWIADRWRVSGQRSEMGPTPELLHTADERTVDSLKDFQEYGHVPAP